MHGGAHDGPQRECKTGTYRRWWGSRRSLVKQRNCKVFPRLTDWKDNSCPLNISQDKNAPWSFAEVYKYCRLHECFNVSKFWKNYDIFYRQKVRNSILPMIHFKWYLEYDTFSRSADAVFELSMRFAEPFRSTEGLSPEEKLEAERLMFLELTQGDCLFSLNQISSLICASLSLGKFHGSVAPPQHDWKTNQSPVIDRRWSPGSNQADHFG